MNTMKEKNKMRSIKHTLIALLVLPFLASCASDLKGEDGDPGDTGPKGADATADALIAFKRPEYRSVVGDAHGTALVVPASESIPARVLINGVRYENTEETIFEIAKSGRNGLDVGSAEGFKVYYLYAIPGTTTGTFQVVGSLRDPETGPSGFEAGWSYLGGFVTREWSGEVQIIGMTAAKGRVFLNGHPLKVETGKISNVPLKILVPRHATAAYGQLHLSLVTDVTKKVVAKSESNAFGLSPITIQPTSASDLTYAFGFIPLIEPQTIYIDSEGGANEAEFFVHGWMEDPTRFQ